MTGFRFSTWAQPVTCRRWAAVAVVAHAISRVTGYRVLVHAKARAWERAVA